MDKTRASKFMSLVLRHDPSAAGITLDAQGWAGTTGLLAGMKRAGFDITRDVLDEIVREDSKQRYAVNDDGQRIRANQGHSLATVDVGHEELPPPAVLYHGAGRKSVEAILRDGLKPMSRQQVHLSIDEPTALAVGKRHGRPVVFRIDCAAMAAAGMKFFRSANGVWLVRSVAPKYLSELPSSSPG